MSLHELEHALEQVRSLQDLCLVKQRFYGYSGKARMLGGGMTLVAAGWIAAVAGPDPWRHLAGWGLLLGAGLLVNYLALAYWFYNDPEVKRRAVRLRPAVEALPPLGVGALLSVGLVLAGHWDLLMPTWMLCYGLANLASRHFLDRAIGLVGLYYLGAGALLLLWPGTSFLHPWPMGIAFFVGETAGGLLMWKGT